VSEYWIVDTDARQFEIWCLAAGAREGERYTNAVPVRPEGNAIGLVELSRVFDWPARLTP
jgi:Uma2 family endonuclease